jgi:hypothetical protein
VPVGHLPLRLVNVALRVALRLQGGVHGERLPQERGQDLGVWDLTARARVEAVKLSPAHNADRVTPSG